MKKKKKKNGQREIVSERSGHSALWPLVCVGERPAAVARVILRKIFLRSLSSWPPSCLGQGPVHTHAQQPINQRLYNIFPTPSGISGSSHL